MIRSILTYPDPFLEKKSAPVPSVDSGVRRLIDDMFETMYESHGVGLAAPQIGVGLRVIVVDVSAVEKEHPAFALVNPEIVDRVGRVEDVEGCLSVPGVEGIVARAEEVEVKALDASGDPVRFRARDFLARALQHEIDHLDGVLFISRLAASAGR
ncbi:MAG TPA: peptide deformylase [Candidatus Deferrimicrobiaceae bacterium]|jgi:peptide deformylase